MTASPTRRVRCAIYTRKSSDEGLEQDFNSLDAQREACAAYVLSQASEGWTALPEIYDDGGISGGTLERPALKRLLGDVRAGRVDVIVVYKVDRLSRSLFDFAKLVETFEKAGTSFVSITQSFNTTSSMGRLTLNMLLSFAQFEREVTAERIRDKIAASKAKGMWMGGVPPLGYSPNGRTLSIVEEQAVLVRMLFDRYIEFGSVLRLSEWLDEQDIMVPRRTLVNGKPIGGGRFSRGQLYFILRNPIYVGDIPHGKERFPGQHRAIIDRAQFEAAQVQLANNRQGETYRRGGGQLLAGKIFDAEGEPLTVSHASKGTTRYHYYVSSVGKRRSRFRTSAIETPVVERIARELNDSFALSVSLGAKVDDWQRLGDRCRHVATSSSATQARSLLPAVKRVQIETGQLHISIDRMALADLLDVELIDPADEPLVLTIDGNFRQQRGLRLVTSNGALLEPTKDGAPARLVVLAHTWWAELRKGEVSVSEFAEREGLNAAYVSRVVRLAFLSPAVTQAALDGRLRDGVDGEFIKSKGGFIASWREQELAMLPAA